MMTSRYGIQCCIAAGLMFSSFSFAENEGSRSTNLFLNAELSPAQSTHELQYPGQPEYNEPLKAFFPDCDPKKSGDYSQATGSGRFFFDAESGELEFSIDYNGLSGTPIMAHFHFGAPGTGGPIVQTICGMPPPPSAAIGYSACALLDSKCPEGTSNKCPECKSTCPEGTSGTFDGVYELQGHPCPTDAKDCTPLTIEQEVRLLLCGNLYVNIHTCLNQPGEVRGQIIPLSWEGEQYDCNGLPPKTSTSEN